ncbi:helix-turn-helix transcriptional regulator [Pararhizobium capsulatum]|nr:LuxR family transcriptional regulator [Pararhizobium capsulatum]
MTDQRAYFDLLDVMESEQRVGYKRFFSLMRKSFDIANMLYLDADLTPSGMKIHRLHCTAPEQIINDWLSRDFSHIAPVLNALTNSVRPVDWLTARKLNPQVEPHLSAVERRGVNIVGVTLPLVTPMRRLAFLAIQSAMPAADWPLYCRSHLRDFQHLANLFHAGEIENDAHHSPIIELSGDLPAALTNRETEVLGWAAAGKSYWEIARILGISERTVRFFMTNARRKLNVVSNAQAVAQAVRQDLIPTF